MARRDSAIGLGSVTKLGRDVYYSALEPWNKCPGRTFEGKDRKVCRHCYAMAITKHRPKVKEAWARASWREQVLEIRHLPPQAMFRGHVSGDIQHIAHALALTAAHEARPDLNAWYYTASWHVQGMHQAILNLAKHVTLYASVCSDVEYHRAADMGHELIAWAHPRPELAVLRMKRDLRRVIRCPHEIGRVKDCQSCRWCVNGHGDVVFRLRKTGANK